MDPLYNPYQPGAGRRPPQIAGRDSQLRAFAFALERCELGYGGRSLVLTGLRGVGKTVLVNEFESMAGQRGWVSAKVEAVRSRSVLGQLSQSLYRSLRVAAGREGPEKLSRLLSVFQSFSLTVDPGAGSYRFGVEVAPARGSADSGQPATDLAELLAELGSTMAGLGRGALLLVDEMQEVAPEELAAINAALHAVGQGAKPLPVLLVGAGLPSLPEVLAAATSYAERLYEFTVLAPLDTPDAHAALTLPAAQQDVAWTDPALVAVDDFARGYPYLIQTAGKFCWDYAVASPISAADAAVGLVAARAEVDAGLYRVRWARATVGQRTLLRAAAELVSASPVRDGAVSMAEVARLLGRERAGLSVPREQLIRKGLLYAPSRGLIAFTVPGMANFIVNQPD